MNEHWRIEIELNEPQAQSFAKLLKCLQGSHHADLCVRKNGQDKWFEADWLREAHTEERIAKLTPPFANDEK